MYLFLNIYLHTYVLIYLYMNMSKFVVFWNIAEYVNA